MDNSKEGGSINRTPMLDGTNNDYRKAHMMAFLKSMDGKIWKDIIKGWKHPVVIHKDGNTTSTLKVEEEWSKDEDRLPLENSKTLNALLMACYLTLFLAYFSLGFTSKT